MGEPHRVCWFGLRGRGRGEERGCCLCRRIMRAERAAARGGRAARDRLICASGLSAISEP